MGDPSGGENRDRKKATQTPQFNLFLQLQATRNGGEGEVRGEPGRKQGG